MRLRKRREGRERERVKEKRRPASRYRSLPAPARPPASAVGFMRALQFAKIEFVFFVTRNIDSISIQH